MSDNSTDTDKTIMNTLFKIKKLYLKSGYMNIHGTDVWVSVILCLVFIYFICYYYYVNLLQVIRADWQKHRCNPILIPFAGFINNPKDKTNLEFTAENFAGCVNSMLKDIAEVAVHPFMFIVNMLQEAAHKLIESVHLFRKLTYNIEVGFVDIVQRIYDSIMNIIAYFILLVVKTKDSVEKIKGLMTTALFSIFGSYMALQSLFGGIVDLLNKFMIYGGHLILLCIIATVGLLAGLITAPLAPIPFFVGMNFTQIWLILIIPVAIYKYLILKYLSIPTPPLPGAPDWSPVCFSGETVIDVMIDKNNASNCIPTLLKNINIGDTLKNGEKVTAFIKGSSVGQTVYNLDGILVTGEHRVYDPSLKWVKVKNHPRATIVSSFNEPFVYCLGTDKKIFVIGDTVVSDWDDIDENVLYHLHEKCVINKNANNANNENNMNNANNNTYLPRNYKLSDIHIQLDSGFTGNTPIVLNNGLSVPICSVNAEDKLLNGIKVIAVVKIDARDMNIYTHQLSDTISINSSKNIHINDPNLGKINCMNLKSNYIEAGKHNELYLYHLITDKKGFIINGVCVNDYNSGIDFYLK